MNDHPWKDRDTDRHHVRPCATDECLEEALAKIRWCFGQHGAQPVNRRPPLSRRVVSEDAVEIHEALSTYDVDGIKALAACVSRHGPDRHPEERPFHDDSGAFRVWNIGWYFKRIAPELYARVKEVASFAARDAGPRFAADPRDLHMRTAEKLSYFRAGRLELHKDLHSTYTLVLLLSDPAKDFKGGHFVAHGHPDVDLVLPNHGGVLVRSDVPHGVTHVERGRREVLAVEFWAHHEPHATDARPDPVRVAAEDDFEARWGEL